MAERTLGRHWKNLTFKQQVEFRHLFEEFLEELYINRIQGHADENIIYLGENMATNILATIKTKISEICVDCKMIMKKQGWKIYDVNIEGVSLIRNYGAQFQKILMEDHPDE